MPQSGFEAGFQVKDTASLDVWVKELSPKMPGAVEGYIYDQLKLTLADMFRRTKSWREFLGPFTLTSGNNKISLNPVDSKVNVIQVLGISINGSPLMPSSDSALSLQFSGSTTQEGTPNRYYVRPYHTVFFSPTPAATVSNIYVDVALTPRFNNCNNIDQWVIDQHYEVVKAGVLERMYNEPNRPYTNTKQGEFWGMRYRSDMASIRAAGDQNFKQGPHPWAFPRHTR